MPSSSCTVSGCTPDSERLKRTRFSHVLCQRSSSNGTKRKAHLLTALSASAVSRQRADVFRPFQPIIWLQIGQMRAVEGPPQRGGGLHPRGAAALDVVAGVADEHGVWGGDAQLLERLEHGLGVRLGVRHLVR